MQPYRTAVFDNARWAGFVHRPGDIFVCTPPKCGTTWTQTIIASLLWPAGDVPGPIMHVVSPWIEAEFEPIDVVLARLAAQSHRRFIKSHTPADGIPFFDTGRYVFVARDGRDAFMSMCNHMERFNADRRETLNARAPEGVPQMVAWDGDVHGFFARWIADGFVLHHVRTFWDRRNDPNVLLVHYNDLKADLAGEMRRIAAFLDVTVLESAWPAVVERCTFESMRARGDEIGTFELFDGGGKSFLFKGSNGRWRDVLDATEQAAYDRRVAEILPPDGARWLEHGRRALA